MQTQGSEGSAPDGATDPAAEIGKAVHALRNGMNSLLMNTAVLATCINDVPESLRPYVASIRQAGQRCSDDLAHLFELVATRRA